VLGPLVRDAKWFPLEAAVRKMTGDPCRRVGLVDRGRVAPGSYADVVLFDATRVGDRATYEAPWAFPDGVHAVLVNGQLALDEGSPTGLRAGRVVHRHARARGDHGTGVEPAGSIAGRRPAG
jgi:N-acyl-D-aspartate/D-glutamate deacylase